MNWNETEAKNRRLAEIIFGKFKRPLALELYELVPTDNIAAVLFNHVQHFMCFFNVVDGEMQPYLNAVQVDGQWYILKNGEVTKTHELWVKSFDRAVTPGYMDVEQTAHGWVVSRLMP